MLKRVFLKADMEKVIRAAASEGNLDFLYFADHHGLLSDVDISGVFLDQVVKFLKSQGFSSPMAEDEKKRELLRSVTADPVELRIFVRTQFHLVLVFCTKNEPL